MRADPIRQGVPILVAAFPLPTILHHVGVTDAVVVFQEEAVHALAQPIETPGGPIDEEMHGPALCYAQIQVRRNVDYELIPKQCPTTVPVTGLQKKVIVGLVVGRLIAVLWEERIAESCGTVLAAKIEPEGLLGRVKRLTAVHP